MTAPRLLHILGSSKFGGDSVLVLELACAARREGFRVDVLATDPRFQERILDEGIGLVDLDVVRREIRLVWDARGYARLRRFLRERSFDVVHTHTSKPGIIGRLAATRECVPGVIHTVHGFGFHEETGRLATTAYARCEALAARWCDRLVTVSEFHRDWALRLGIGRPEQVVAIPNGVPEHRVVARRSRADVLAAHDVQEGFVVLSTGRLAEQKGLEYLVRAAALLPPAPVVTILLAGDGPLAGTLTQLAARLGVAQRVRFLGFTSQVGDLLAACDLVVLPSLWEGLSVSLLEAMAAGKPIVTTTIGSNVEVTAAGTCAVLVPPKDPAALAAAIMSLAGDRDRRASLGAAAREMQVRRYTLDRMLDAYMTEYAGLLLRSRARGRVQRREGVAV